MPVIVRHREHPLSNDYRVVTMPDGMSLSGIVEHLVTGDRHPTVHCSTHTSGAMGDPIPHEMWRNVRPRPGTVVSIEPSVSATLIPAAGLWLSVTLGGAISATTGALIVTAAVATAVYFATGFLFPTSDDSEKRSQDRQNPTISGLHNTLATVGAPVMKVFGRHRIALMKTATGYTELVGQTVYRRERMTFGLGPVALDDLRIGTTSISKYKDVELQFRNVKRSLTEAAIPALKNMDVEWLSDSDTMTNYSKNVFEDSDGSRLEHNAAVTRTTRANTRRAVVQIGFAGLVKLTDESKKRHRSVKVKVEYRPASGGSWVTESHKTYRKRSTATVRFGVYIKFPSADEWDIRVTRTTPDSDDAQIRDDTYFETLRSITRGGLPSPSGVAEVTLRIRATDQISGMLDPVNAVVQQLADQWDGSTFATNVPIRHPADQYIDLLRNETMRKKPVDVSEIDLDGIRNWRLEWPDWTFDGVVTNEVSLRDLVDSVLSAGLAIRTRYSNKYSVLTDKSAEPAVQIFTPRDTAESSVEWAAAPDIHGIRTIFTSEAADWGDDEVITYASGYDSSNATLIETYEPIGHVVQDGGSIENVAKIGYYHLAQIQTRRRKLTFKTMLNHLVCRRGDPIIFQSDALMNSFGEARIIAVTTSGSDVLTLELDSDHLGGDGVGLTARIMVRDGSTKTMQYVTATLDAANVWQVEAGSGVRYSDSGSFDASAFHVGDLAIIFADDTVPGKWLVKEIYPDYGEYASIEAVEASEIPLTHMNRDLPDYDPHIIESSNVLSISSTLEYDAGQLYVVVEWVTVSSGVDEEFRVQAVDEDGAAIGTIFTGDKIAKFAVQSAYPMSVTTSVSKRKPTGGWGDILSETTSTGAHFIAVPAVENFMSQVSNDVIYLSWSPATEDTAYYEIRWASATSGASWSSSVVVEAQVTATNVQLPARNGTFFIKAVSDVGAWSSAASTVIITTASTSINVIETLNVSPDFDGTVSAGVASSPGQLIFASDGNLWDIDDLWDVVNLWTHGRTKYTGTFTATDVVDLGTIETATLSAAVAAQGLTTAVDLWAVENLWDVVDFWGTAESDWSVTVEVSTTDDDPSGSPVWSDWSEMVISDYRARAFRFRLVFEVTDLAARIVVTDFSVVVDMADRQVNGRDVTVPITGLTVAFDPPFRETPTLLIDGQVLPSGAWIDRNSVDNEGFTVYLRDSSDTAITGSIDYSAFGYGEGE